MGRISSGKIKVHVWCAEFLIELFFFFLASQSKKKNDLKAPLTFSEMEDGDTQGSPQERSGFTTFN